MTLQFYCSNKPPGSGIEKFEINFFVDDEDMQFKVEQIFQRQIYLNWQRYLESKKPLNFVGQEHYVAHAFTFKVSTKGKFDPRFLVFSNLFLYNVEMVQKKGILL